MTFTEFVVVYWLGVASVVAFAVFAVRKNDRARQAWNVLRGKTP